jgi:uncharacterized glyoxalase superfamily protein PhnB
VSPSGVRASRRRWSWPSTTACAAYDRMRARGVEFTQEPTDRYGTVDAGFRDPSGNGWKMIQTRAERPATR